MLVLVYVSNHAYECPRDGMHVYNSSSSSLTRKRKRKQIREKRTSKRRRKNRRMRKRINKRNGRMVKEGVSVGGPGADIDSQQYE